MHNENKLSCKMLAVERSISSGLHLDTVPASPTSNLIQSKNNIQIHLSPRSGNFQR